MRRTLFALLASVCLIGSAQAQQHDTLQQGTTIAVTNTFQQVLPRDDNRHGCTIQNTGTHTMFVFFGPAANASLTNSFQVAAGQQIYCGSYPIVIISQVSITGTAADTYVWSVQ